MALNSPSFLPQPHAYQLAAMSLSHELFVMTETTLAAEVSLFNTWSNTMSDLLTGSGDAAPAVSSAADQLAPTPGTARPAVSAAGTTAKTSQAAPASTGVIGIPPPTHTQPLGRFTALATPFDPTLKGTMLPGPGGVYFSAGSNLWFLNESTGKWSGPMALPAGPAIQLMLLPSGTLAGGVGVGNVDLSGGTTPSQFAVMNPQTGKSQLSNLLAGYAVSGNVVAGDGSILAVTSWSGALVGQLSNKVNEGVWASSDGLHFSLRSRVPDTGALWFLDKATDGSNRLWSGGEGPLGPFQSTDNGHTWLPLGTSNLLGFTGNAWGVAELPDGTLLVQKRLVTLTGQYPLVRGKPGGPWLPSSSGLPTFLDVTRLMVLPTGAIIAGSQDTNSGNKPNGGAYVSYDNGNTWSSLSSDGVPAGIPMNAITATSTNAYLWPQGQAPMVASL
jgi:hypothetical protein